jgi:hypothetical protein
MLIFGAVDPGPGSLEDEYGPQLFGALMFEHLHGETQRMDRKRAFAAGAPVVGVLVDVPVDGLLTTRTRQSCRPGLLDYWFGPRLHRHLAASRRSAARGPEAQG